MIFPKKYGTPIVATLLIVAAAVLIYFGMKETPEAGFPRKLVLEAARPLQSLKSWSLGAVRDHWGRYLFLVGLEAENRRLRKENEALENRLAQYREDWLEALRLRKLLNVPEEPGTTRMIAGVIGYEQSSVFRSIMIGRGTAHGLAAGLPVLNDRGVIGRTTECSWHACRIMLIVDRSSNVPALLQGSRMHGVLQGDGSSACQLKYVPKVEEVNVGDAVISSGLGGVFPKGILLGVVSAVDRKEGSFFQRIDVQPSVDFGKLEELIVLNLRKDAGR